MKRFVMYAVVVSIIAAEARAQVSTRTSVYEFQAAADSTVSLKTGEAVSGFPSWAERVIHQWMNRARVDPQTDLQGCVNCPDRACYIAQPPLVWSHALSRAARFHADHMRLNGYFAHDSACTLVSNISSLYPDSCGGAAACACVGATLNCAPNCTTFEGRVALFGPRGNGEIIAGTAEPNNAFYMWLHEPTLDPTCNFTLENGHRWLILNSTGSVGVGTSGRAVGDFSTGGVIPKIPSTAHYPRQAASVAVWANWYDAAAPLDAFVVVNGTSIPMVLGRGTGTNGAYSATVNGVGSGCHRYYVVFRDSTGASHRYPTRGTLGIGPSLCPDWSGESVRGDFTGDMRSDIFLRNTATGANLLWTMNGAVVQSGAYAPTAGPEWTARASGDFNGDGSSDLVWMENATGRIDIWLMRGAALQSNRPYQAFPPGWQLAAWGDVDRDGDDDLLWRSSAGANLVWFMNGATVERGQYMPSVDPGWTLVATGDFNADGSMDLVWREQATGRIDLWIMNGTAYSSDRVYDAFPPGWHIVAAGDTNADGMDDLLWRNTSTGANLIWRMNGAVVVLGQYAPSVDPSWTLAAWGDFNADSKLDFVWRNASTGQMDVWLMDGGTLLSNASYSGYSNVWSVVAPR